MNNNIEIITLTDSNADSFLLKFKCGIKNRNILIDGGLKRNGRNAIQLIEEIFIAGEILDLVILVTGVQTCALPI